MKDEGGFNGISDFMILVAVAADDAEDFALLDGEGNVLEGPDGIS